LFRQSEKLTAATTPQSLFFRGRIAVFRAREDQVQDWITAIDAWIASTNRRYGEGLDAARREPGPSQSTDATEKERIRRLNDRFKEL
jgi:hypothetical protein